MTIAEDLERLEKLKDSITDSITSGVLDLPYVSELYCVEGNVCCAKDNRKRRSALIERYRTATANINDLINQACTMAGVAAAMAVKFEYLVEKAEHVVQNCVGVTGATVETHKMYVDELKSALAMLRDKPIDQTDTEHRYTISSEHVAKHVAIGKHSVGSAKNVGIL